MGSKEIKEIKDIKVAIISRESDEKTLDVAMLEEELSRRGIRVKVLSKLLTKDKSVRNALGYLGQIVRQEAEILRSDVVVLDTYCIPASMLPHRKGTKVVQIWHALGAVKKFGWQTVGKTDGSSARTAKRMRMHEGYDYVVCPSEATARHYCEAFRVSRDKIVKLGLPRIDFIKAMTHGDEGCDMKERVLDRYPKLRDAGKKTVLYAPTFRRGQMPDAAGLADALDPQRYNVLVKLHPLYAAGVKAERDNVIYGDDFSTYELLSAADIVVSDYSALVIEATLSDRPLYLYTYDEEEYGNRTGLNMDFSSEAIGKYTFSDARELAKALEQPYDFDALRAFGRKYIEAEGAWDDEISDAQIVESDGSGDDVNSGVRGLATGRRRCTEALADFIEELGRG